MRAKVKRLSLVDAIRQRQGSFGLRIVRAIIAVTISIFFRRIELSGAENIPEKSGLIFVSNHPNALIDPALLFIALPRKIAFLAKSTLFKIPVLALLIRTVGALPLYRRQDTGADVSKNQETFETARKLLKEGGAIAIFPEGISHNKPQLQPLKTGAARIALGAVSMGKNPSSLDLRIVPVGLFYTNKTTFRSEALLYFGESFNVPPVLLDEDGQPPAEKVKQLTVQIENALRNATLNAAGDSELEIARIAENVLTSVTPHRENLKERFEILRNFVAETANTRDKNLEERLAEYNKKLDEIGVESEFLELANYSKKFVIKEAVIRLWWLILLAPLTIIGAILYFPAYQICKFSAYLQTRKGDYDMASTMKVLSAMVLMPLTQLIFAVLCYFYFDRKIALLSVPFSFLCGYVALRSFEEIEELKGWLKAISVFFLRRDKFLRLFAERNFLFEKISGESE